MALSFILHKKHKFSNARVGEIKTKHGIIKTPTFMPVGTQGTVKAMKVEDLKQAGTQIILGNTYHLMLRPSGDLIEKFGGLHNFMNWDRPILTDSGGYQVMSLSNLRKLKEDGVEFKSHIDGTKYFLTPELSINIQKQLDSNITMIFDECTPYPATLQQAEDSMNLSLNWAKKSKDAFVERDGYGLFGIVQGGVYKNLREKSALALNKLEFDGMAIGGLAVGEGQEIMFQVLDFTLPFIPENKPRYLMGVGKPDDIIGAIKRGVDMFDCVLPTRSGRNGQAFTSNGTVNINNAKYREGRGALDENCSCNTCQNYTTAYLNHLFKAKEMLGAMLLTQHNIHYYNHFIAEIREKILNDEEF
jgi:queuine tRNA-ribosyltransferase